VAARILQVSDAHIGRGEDLAPLEALAELGARVRPDVVVATGDLAHRGRRHQLERSAEILRALGRPVLAVPGNHDIPYTFPARYTSTFAEWERAYGDREPLFASETLVVAGLNSVRPWRQQGGALDEDQLARVSDRLRDAPAGAYRVVALHHHLAAPPWPSPRKKPIRRKREVLRALAEAGAELVLSGHVHQSALAERREFEALEDGSRRSLVLASGPGIGRPRPRRSGETRGVNVYEADADALTVTTLIWDGHEFVEIGQRVFPRR
jgi:3',5'-cyclic AMP phosphodiesterase CpdA